MQFLLWRQWYYLEKIKVCDQFRLQNRIRVDQNEVESTLNVTGIWIHTLSCKRTARYK